DVQVGDRANARADRPQAEAAPRAALDELCRRGAAGSGLEEHDVGLRFPRRPPGAGDARESRGAPTGTPLVARPPPAVLLPRAPAVTAANVSQGQTVPPPMLWVCSMQTSLAGGA